MAAKQWVAIALSAMALAAASGANAQSNYAPNSQAPAGDGAWKGAQNQQQGFAGGHREMNPQEREAIKKLTPQQRQELRALHEQIKADHEKMRADVERFKALRAKYGLPEMHREGPGFQGGQQGVQNR